jgi:hypothetical protein
MIASLFISKDNKSYLKLGSYDQQALKDDTELVKMATRDAGSWAIKLWTANMIGGDPLSLKRPDTTWATFEPSLPYIYLPEDDFVKW